MSDKKLLLVKLPPVKGIEQDHFGIGYYADHGFVFAVLTEDCIDTRPLRIITYREYGDDHVEDIEILGQIKNLPNPK